MLDLQAAAGQQELVRATVLTFWQLLVNRTARAALQEAAADQQGLVRATVLTSCWSTETARAALQDGAAHQQGLVRATVLTFWQLLVNRNCKSRPAGGSC
jgi:hypothetical protein